MKEGASFFVFMCVPIIVIVTLMLVAYFHDLWIDQGFKVGRDVEKKEAIRAGAAVYITDNESGKAVFTYITSPK